MWTSLVEDLVVEEYTDGVWTSVVDDLVVEE